MRGHRHVAAHHRPERDDETDNDNTSDQLKSLLENPPKNIKINLKVDEKQRQGDTTHSCQLGGIAPSQAVILCLLYYNIQEIYPLLYC